MGDAYVGLNDAPSITRREEARAARDHVCTACPVVANLDLKMVLHRGQAVRQIVGSRTDLLGPAINTDC